MMRGRGAAAFETTDPKVDGLFASFEVAGFEVGVPARTRETVGGGPIDLIDALSGVPKGAGQWAIYYLRPTAG